MSRLKTPEEYKKTLSYRFKKWFRGQSETSMVEQKNIEIAPKSVLTEEELNRLEARRRSAFYRMTRNRQMKLFQWTYRIICVCFCVFLVWALLRSVSYMPTVGRADNPVNNEVSRRYIENGLQETGAVNIVTGMILDYRAFDTLGESHVLFIATCTVLILLRRDKKKTLSETGARAERGKVIKMESNPAFMNTAKDEDAFDEEDLVDEENDRKFEPKNDVILQTVTKFLFPPIVIFGIYVILGGHLGPGGGFSGGAIIGAGLILYVAAFGFEKTEKFFTGKTYKIMSLCALGCYAMCKSYSFYTGANHIHSIIPLGTPGAIISSGLILILNICVGIVVAGTMYTFYVMFRKGDY